MIKLIAFIPKHPDITIERFHIHWRAPHGELAKGIVLFKRYVQGHRVASVDPGRSAILLAHMRREAHGPACGTSVIAQPGSRRSACAWPIR